MGELEARLADIRAHAVSDDPQLMQAYERARERLCLAKKLCDNGEISEETYREKEKAIVAEL